MPVIPAGQSAHPPLTWGDVKAWAETNGITDAHVVLDQDHRAIRDLGESETAENKPALILQTRWG